MSYITTLLMLFLSMSLADEKTCSPLSACEPCDDHHMQHEYCQATGWRIELSCLQKTEAEVLTSYEYHSCSSGVREGNMSGVLFFQFLMLIFGVGGWILVQRRKSATMTSYGYDYRKMNQNQNQNQNQRQQLHEEQLQPLNTKI